MLTYLSAIACLALCLWGSLVGFHVATQSSIVQGRCATVQAAERLERLLAEVE